MGFTAQYVRAVCSEPRLQWSCRVQYRRAPPESREPQVHYAFHFELSFDWYIFRIFFMLSNSWQSSHSVTWARNILASLCFWFWIDFWLVHFQKPYWTATFLSNPHIWLLGPHVESWPTVYEDTLQTTLGAEMRSGLCNLLPGNQRRKKPVVHSLMNPGPPTCTSMYPGSFQSASSELPVTWIILVPVLQAHLIGLSIAGHQTSSWLTFPERGLESSEDEF